jgi:hypothetical protein
VRCQLVRKNSFFKGQYQKFFGLTGLIKQSLGVNDPCLQFCGSSKYISRYQ